MKAIVFGSSGFIGSHIVEQLALAGHDVTAVVRVNSDKRFLQSLNIDIKQLDFSKPDNISPAISGHDVVYNCLANPRLHQSIESHRQVEVYLTQTLAKAAISARAKRFVQLSTIQCYGFRRPPIAINENHPYDAQYTFNQIAIEREETINAIFKNSTVELVVAQPVNTMGKRDQSMAQLLASHTKGIMPVFGDGKKCFSLVDTRDVGKAMVLLGTVPEAANETFIISGQDINWLELKQALDHAAGKSTRLFCIPARPAKLIAKVLEFILPYSINLNFTPFSVDVMTTQTLFDDSKIRTLGYKPVYTLGDAVEAMITP